MLATAELTAKTKGDRNSVVLVKNTTKSSPKRKN